MQPRSGPHHCTHRSKCYPVVCITWNQIFARNAIFSQTWSHIYAILRYAHSIPFCTDGLCYSVLIDSLKILRQWTICHSVSLNAILCRWNVPFSGDGYIQFLVVHYVLTIFPSMLFYADRLTRSLIHAILVNAILCQ